MEGLLNSMRGICNTTFKILQVSHLYKYQEVFSQLLVDQQRGLELAVNKGDLSLRWKWEELLTEIFRVIRDIPKIV